jgi:prolyl oligopeptidase
LEVDEVRTIAVLWGVGGLTLIALLGACSTPETAEDAAEIAGWSYPDAERTEQVDDYHGTRVADPYRGFEDYESATTNAWIAEQNELSRQYFDALPTRAHFERRLTELYDYERFSIPEEGGGRYVYSYNSGTDEQDSIWTTSDVTQRGELLLDAEELSDDGTASIGSYFLSPDGHLLAYGVSEGGTDWRTWRVRDVGTRQDRDDELQGIKFSPVSWSRDSSGFFYSRYPLAADGSSYDDQQQVSVWYHAIGAAQSEDIEIYRVPDSTTRNPYGSVTDDGQYLVIELFDGYEANAFYYKRMREGVPEQETVRLLDAWDARYEFLGNVGTVFFFKTILGAPLGRVVAIDLTTPDAEDWTTIIPEAESAIGSASLVGGKIFVQYLIDAHAQVRVFALDGSRGPDISLPGKGSIDGFGGRVDDAETYFSYTDFATPRAVYRYGIDSGRVTPVSEPRVSVDTNAFETRQVFVESKDGTQVPIYIVRRKDVDLSEPQPTVLYGYGGFNISLLPSYSSSRVAWLDAGGVYVSANLRGGGEYGESWYRAGTQLQKQNVFDDFIAVAEWLIDNGVSRTDQLAIWGVSNGGLLAAATETQRPELFAAVVPAVGVLDMLRYHTASANARQWSTDYGLSDSADEFAAQYAYSPLHNLRDGQCYPPTLVIADTNDDRVLPWHSYKYAAALQHAQGCDNPVLIRIETRSGHGAGRSLSKNVEQYADQWAFVAEHTGLAVTRD